MEELLQKKKNFSFAGYTSIAGSVSMLLGAAFWGASGTDLWQALATNQMESYLSQLEAVKNLVVPGTFFWTIGVLLFGTAGRAMAGFCRPDSGLAQLAVGCISSAVPVAIVSFMTMLSLAIHPLATDAAYVIGWIGARLDDVATLLIIGVFPLLISIAGRSDWIPRWLAVWGYLAGIAGFLSIVSLFTGIVPLGFVIIPFGIGWMLAAGFTLIRKKVLT